MFCKTLLLFFVSLSLLGCAVKPAAVEQKPAPPVVAQAKIDSPVAPISIAETLTNTAAIEQEEVFSTSTAVIESVSPAQSPSAEEVVLWQQSGIASWYGPGFQGKRTANGERFDTMLLTAAHRTLPFGTRVRVTSLVNGKQVVVRINDRGPYIKGRIIDLSRAAAQAIDMPGVKQVKVERLQ